MFPVFKKDGTLIVNFEMVIYQGWNIMTLYESAGECFQEDYPGLIPEDSVWIIFVNGVEADPSLLIQETEKIHFVVQDRLKGQQKGMLYRSLCISVIMLLLSFRKFQKQTSEP